MSKWSYRTPTVRDIPKQRQSELDDSRQFFDKFGTRLPREMREEHERLASHLQRTVTA